MIKLNKLSFAGFLVIAVQDWNVIQLPYSKLNFFNSRSGLIAEKKEMLQQNFQQYLQDYPIIIEWILSVKYCTIYFCVNLYDAYCCFF